MTHYLLDTNHLSPLVTEGHPVRDAILERKAAGDSFTISTVALSEFLYGILLLPRSASNLKLWQAIADGFFYRAVDRKDAEAAAELRMLLRRKGRQMMLTDAVIAAVALRYGLVLLTTDGDFEGVAGLVRENWW